MDVFTAFLIALPKGLFLQTMMSVLNYPSLRQRRNNTPTTGGHINQSGGQYRQQLFY